jgi:opacity protein-like surface antigen
VAAKIDASLPRSSWTGFYAGVTAGAVKSKIGREFDYDYSNASYIPDVAYRTGATIPHELSNKPVTGAALDALGSIGGLQVGYNHQFSNSIVAGVEFDISRLGAKRSTGITTSGSTLPYTWQELSDLGSYDVRTNNSVLTGTAETSMDWVSTLRGRIGYSTPSWLIFGSAGIAFGGLTASTSQLVRQTSTSCSTYSDISYPCYVYTNTSTNAGGMSSTLIGYAASVGAEYAITENLFLRGEFFYFNLGSMKFPISMTRGAAAATMSINVSASALRSGLLYKF